MKTVALLLALLSLGCSRSMLRRDEPWRQLVDPNRHDLDVGGLSMHYIDLGNGEPVVLVHGIADSSYSWHENVQALLDAGLRVILIDQPGFGGSGIPGDGNFAVERQGAAILHLLDQIGVETFGLVGHSLGGGVSLYLAWQLPERVRRLAVISPVSQHEKCPFGRSTDFAMSLVGTRGLVATALRTAYYEPDQVSDTAIDEYGRLLARPGRGGAGVLGGVCRTYFSPTFDRMIASYGAIKVPLLILWGKEDSWHALRHGEQLHDLVPGSDLAVIPQASHNVHQERAEQVNTLLTRFLRANRGDNVDTTGAFQATRVRRSWTQRLPVRPDKVFPLLCPVREYEWIPDWRSETVYLASGRAEHGGVFTTDFPTRGRGTWVITRYEPPLEIGFAIFYADRYVEHLEATLTPDGADGSNLRWTRTYTGLSEEGNRYIAEATGAPLEQRMQRQMRLLEHFCATGTMLVE